MGAFITKGESSSFLGKGDIVVPLIGVSGSHFHVGQDDFRSVARAYVNDNYLRSVENQGGLPIILPFTKNKEHIKSLVSRIDGLVLTGGQDVYPLHYGEEPLQGLGQVWPERDQFDFALLEAAIERGIPVFAICRGHQVVNVYRGGTLYQDLKYDENCTIKHWQNQSPGMPYHTVDFTVDSKIADILGKTAWVTNSHHHQTVKVVGKGLKITGRSKDGTIEALEATDYPWLVTCQFHPEMMTKESQEAQALFKAFVDACEEYMI